MNKAKLLANLKEIAHEQYENSLRVYEILTFIKEILGDPKDPTGFTLSDNGTAGLHAILSLLVAKAETAACSCIYEMQLDDLAGMAGDTIPRNKNTNPIHPENIQSRAFGGQNDGTDMDIYTPGGGHE